MHARVLSETFTNGHLLTKVKETRNDSSFY